MAASAIQLDVPPQAALPSAQTGRRRGRRQPLKPLFDGERVTCPRCRQEKRVLEFQTKPEMPVYMSQTVPIIICPSCRWEFALRSAPDGLDRRTPR